MLKQLSPKTRRNISRVLPFGVIWFLFSQIFLISDYAAVGDLNDIPDTAIKLDLGIYFFATLAVCVLGLVVGAIELVYLNNRFSQKSFGRKILYKTLFYTFLLFCVVVISFPIAASMELGTSVLDKQVWDKLFSFLISKTLLGTVIQLGTMLGVSLFYAEISEHMGHRVLINFFSGKYHTPKEETRIFMFSDMKSSTQIAEQLGHTRYYELLRAYYSDLSDGIISYGGEIYQYVGDEVVVSWPAEKGVKNQNCLACFFAMKQALENRAGWYQQRFGLVPDFKAGFHVGAVTTGEIGALKKEIIFTGDVLNATARIQGLCNEYNVELLISGDLLEQINVSENFNVRSLGQCELRGKTRSVELFTLV
ncbi:MAG: adenylate/guanylate cyclase domain-containing protein [Rhodothermales bacterium]